jgi:PD-(D/E)XK endonuclease
VLTTDQKGVAAELAIALAAVELGVGVYYPYGDERADLIFDLRPRLLRVQCKWAACRRDVIVVRCHRNRRTAGGLLRRTYRRDEVDAFAIYCPVTGKCYLLPFDQVPPSGVMSLRLSRTRNNQRIGVNWAEDYEFGATLGALGAVAQLGERQRGTLEATGSSPVGSTSEAAHDRAASLF